MIHKNVIIFTKNKNMSILYHYTTIDALQKILEDNGKIQFLATRYDYLNDKGELELGIDLLNKCLIEIEEKLNIDTSLRLSRHSKTVGEQLKHLYEIENAGLYTLSFSENADSLPMWRMYGSDCNGIVIGLDTNSLLDRVREKEFQQYEIKYRPMMYLKKEVKKEIELAYEKILGSYTGATTYGLENEYSNIVHQLCINIKSKHYKYEREWRITLFDWDVPREGQTPQITTEYRIRNGIMIPCKKLSFPSSALKKIVVGPTHNFEQSKKSLKMFLESKKINLSNIKIEQSKILYRN